MALGRKGLGAKRGLIRATIRAIAESTAIPSIRIRRLSHSPMKPYQQIPILDCGEPLVAIPGDQFALVLPHPYELLGAPYSGRSPFYLRQGVLTGLIQAQTYLQQQYPQWQISIFDAYRPIAVQQFMVDYAFMEQVRSQGLDPGKLSPSERQEILGQVYQFWAVPSLDPATPPPHATGAAVDVTLVEEGGIAVEMGSPIDEISPRSHPDYFAESSSQTDQDVSQPSPNFGPSNATSWICSTSQ